MVSYSEAFKKSVEYFGGSELAASAFVGKYALKNSEGDILEATPDEMHQRLAREFVRVEQKYPNPLSYEEIYGLLRKFKKIIPQGSPMMGIGNKHHLLSLSNCFVIKEPYDSMSGIGVSIIEEKEIMKRRGGVGFDISTLRPKGLATSNAAGTTDGIEVFMEDFSDACRRTAQNGRRGALMLTISCHHPEIMTFIKIKRDLKKVTGANISIRFTDEFLNAVKDNGEVELRWPVDSKTPTISTMVDAKEVWTEFVDSAWASAEPGALFWDNAKKNTPADCYEKFGYGSISTNPCQPGWATVLTPEGIRTFDQIQVGSTIWSGQKWTKVVNKVCTGTKQVNAYRTTAGVFYGTDTHRIVSNGEKVEVGAAESIDVSYGASPPNSVLDPKDILDGLAFGDGTYHKASNKVFLLIGKDDQCYFDSEIKHLLTEARPGVKPTAWSVQTRISHLEKTYNRSLSPDFLYSATQVELRGFLRGLYTANGSVVNNRVTLKATSKKLVEQVQIILSSMGIGSYYTTNKAHEVEFTNGIYECKESYDLNIGTKQGRQLFHKLIGFIHPEKTNKLEVTLETKANSQSSKTNFDIIETDSLGEEKVYDITVEADEHTYWSGGLLVSNCGEIVLSAYDSCRLLLVNCMGSVNNPFDGTNSSFDWDGFATSCFLGQKLMDDMIDLELEHIEAILAKIERDPEPPHIKQVEWDLWTKIRNACLNGRRTGLGLTAVGDVVASLGMRYGSPESIEFVEKLYKTMEVASYKSSVEMARDRGAFPVFSHDLEKGSAFINKVLDSDPELKENYNKYGRRNIANTTTPPAGTTSMLACLSEEHNLFGTTSGIEPAYLLSYKRRKKINPNDENATVNFVDDMGDKWQEFEVFHPGYKLWMEVTEKRFNEALAKNEAFYYDPKPENSPYWKSTSADVDWKASVDLQAAAQRWVCHSISKTCNLPKEATRGMVNDVYMRAWESGCKGFTIYRDGSRSGVLVALDDTGGKEKVVGFTQHNAPKRPKEIPCDIYHSTVNGEKWTIFVGLVENKPYEIMGGLAKYVKIPKRVTQGKLVKHNGEINPARYDLHYDFDKGPDEETIIQDVGNVFENPTNSGFTRVLSLAMRHGAPIQYAVEQLVKAGDKESDLFSVTKAFSRVLKNYVKDGTKTTAVKKCKSCGSDNLAYKDGCIQCLNCGDSKCG